MMWECEQREDAWEFRRSTVGRIVAALWIACLSAPVAALGGFLFFGLDWVGRTSAGVEFRGDFWLTVLLFAGFAGFLGFVIRLLRYRRWIVDPDAGTIALSHRRAFGEPQLVEVPLDELVRVDLESAGFGSESRIVLVFADDTVEALATSRFGPGGLVPLLDGLRASLAGRSITVGPVVG